MDRFVIIGRKDRTFIWRNGGKIYELPELGYLVPDEEVPPNITVPRNHLVVLVSEAVAGAQPKLVHQFWHRSNCAPFDLRKVL